MRIINPFVRQTSVKIETSKFLYNQDSLFCSIGSCFADHVADYFKTHLMSIHHNPYGITYNPFSIAIQLEQSLSGYTFDKEELFFHDGLYHSFQHHGSFSAPYHTTILKNIERHQADFSEALSTANCLILTLGTAFVFQHIPSEQIVNNCHKIPGDQFNRIRLSVDQIVTYLEQAFQKCWRSNPNLRIIMTVSPVRHIRDGLVENMRSKATLILAIDQLIDQFDHVKYFPSYEICMDELRDYRFYEKDLIHPNNDAVQYILEQFVAHSFEDNAHHYFQELDKVKKLLNHRPLHPDRVSYHKFVNNTRKKIKALSQKYPGKDIGKWETLLER